MVPLNLDTASHNLPSSIFTFSKLILSNGFFNLSITFFIFSTNGEIDSLRFVSNPSTTTGSGIIGTLSSKFLILFFNFLVVSPFDFNLSRFNTSILSNLASSALLLLIILSNFISLSALLSAALPIFLYALLVDSLNHQQVILFLYILVKYF